MEIFLIDPFLIEAVLNALRIVGFGEFFAHLYMFLLLLHSWLDYRIMFTNSQ